MVPMQNNNMLDGNVSYACFTIFFILTGLTTLASTMNLLVLRLATINAEEHIQEKIEADEAKRQAVHLEGDVISPNDRLLVKQEVPEQYDTTSVCSCTCIENKIWKSKKRKKNNMKDSKGRVKRLSNSKYTYGDYNDRNSPNKLLAKFCFKSGAASNSKISLPENLFNGGDTINNSNYDDNQIEELSKLKRNSI
jgi:hypothetical protein